MSQGGAEPQTINAGLAATAIVERRTRGGKGWRKRSQAAVGNDRACQWYGPENLAHVIM
jgi:hypothetical protein